jgi:hypothetical protein
MMLFSFIGGVSFPGVPAPWFVWLRTEGYTACSLFTHLLRLPPADSVKRITETPATSIDATAWGRPAGD